MDPRTGRPAGGPSRCSAGRGRRGRMPDGVTDAEPRVRRVASAALSAAEIGAVRELLERAFGTGEEAFGEDDWRHALGGVHVLLELGGRIVAHASVVERELHVDGRPVRTGYVEAVATDPALQGTGLGSRVMREVGAIVAEGFELGALGTGRRRFYERLGWRTWRGPTSVRTPAGPRRTPDEDGYVLVLATPSSPPLDPEAPISCDWRPGDVW